VPAEAVCAQLELVSQPPGWLDGSGRKLAEFEGLKLCESSSVYVFSLNFARLVLLCRAFESIEPVSLAELHELFDDISMMIEQFHLKGGREITRP
jgi:hypothetical protein